MSMTALALRNGWKKHAFVQAGPGGQIPPPNPAGGAGGAPMDPAMGGMAGAMPPGMAAGGGAMPPPGGMPPGGMPPGGAPPMDPAMMGMDPAAMMGAPPPMDPAAMGMDPAAMLGEPPPVEPPGSPQEPQIPVSAVVELLGAVTGKGPPPKADKEEGEDKPAGGSDAGADGADLAGLLGAAPHQGGTGAEGGAPAPAPDQAQPIVPMGGLPPGAV